jgi:rfaE bifunctional protein nucleotidyltransferase chain/domain
MKSKRAPIFEDVDELKRYLSETSAGAIVLADGCFDPLHVGHIRYLDGAKEHGDILVVALNNDRSTRELRGEGRPVMGERDRAQLISSLGTVDAVLMFGDGDVSGTLQTLRPAVHAKGTDYTVDSVPELETSRKLGIETVIVGDPKSPASSDVLRQIRKRVAKEGES